MVDTKDRMLGGLWGAVVGDALGVPVEFQSRESLRQRPVTDMMGDGTYGQRRGTWSDDTSMALCTVEALISGFDTRRLADLFVRWYQENHWTPWGRVFDIGITTRLALSNLASGVGAEQAGLAGSENNGNGSLMRILPVALRYWSAPTHDLLDYAHRASSLTHRHPISRIGCGLYCAMVACLLEGCSVEDAYRQALEKVKPYYQDQAFHSELAAFNRVLSGSMRQLEEVEIHSEGYVVYTLEAALWCVLTTGSYQDAVLKAVNLGKDTDTTATVAGGLAGVYYGIDGVPARWRDQIARQDDIAALFEKFLVVANA